MNEQKARSTIVRVRRGTSKRAGRFDDFEGAYGDGLSVHDALRWIRVILDSTLAVRYSCINANACKTCMARVNGKVEYTCMVKLTPGVITVEPLPKRPLIRDLVTDIVPDEEKLEISRKHHE